MKVGYSNSLSEIIAASELEYGDCARFQVTCPCCREAVFKGVRQGHDGTETHYLSHYRAESADARECEMRVAAMSDAFLARWSAEGRRQTLAGFMRVLQEAVIQGQASLGLLPAEEMRQRVNRLRAHPSLPSFAADAEDSIRRFYLGPDGRGTVAADISGFSAFHDRSPFWQRRQAAYVLDVLDHLLTGQQATNLRFMVAAAITMAVLAPRSFRLAGAKDEDFSSTRDVAEALLNGKSPSVVDRLMARDTRPGKNLMRSIEAEAAGDPAPGILDRIMLPGIAEATASLRPDRLSLLASASVVSPGKGQDQTSVQMLRKSAVRAAAAAKREELMREVEHLNAQIRRVRMRLVFMGPLIGLLAAVPFPELAGGSTPRPQARASGGS